MKVDPQVVERARRSVVKTWVYYWQETLMYESYKAEEAAWRMSEAGKVH